MNEKIQMIDRIKLEEEDRIVKRQTKNESKICKLVDVTCIFVVMNFS